MRNPVKGVSISAAMCATAAVLLHVNAWGAADAWSTAATAKPAVTAVPAHTNAAAADTVPLSPATTMYAMRGLSQTTSAESMGEGRLTVSLSATWYRQDRYFGTIPQDADVTTGILAFSYGINPYLDIFGSAAGYSFSPATTAVPAREAQAAVSRGRCPYRHRRCASACSLVSSAGLRTIINQSPSSIRTDMIFMIFPPRTNSWRKSWKP